MLKFVNSLKRIKCKKSAMTLAELLVCFSIMGIIAAMAMHIINPLDKGLKYAYSNAYHSLRTAIYNARTQMPDYLAPTVNGSAEGMDGDWPTTTENFCKMLVEYINFKPCNAKDYGTNVHCGVSGGSGSTADQRARSDIGSGIPLNQATNNFTVANCHGDLINLGQANSTTFTWSDMDSALRTAPPHFIASNGMKFWIGGIYNTEEVCVPTSGGPFGSSEEHHGSGAEQCSTHRTPSPVYNAANGSGLIELQYYIVLVDLNGNSRPNTTRWTIEHPADIVAFAVTNTNDVVPLGYPEIDRRYLSARVVYNATFDQSSELGGTSNYMTLYEAKRHAWAQNSANTATTDVNDGLRVGEDNILGADFYNHYVTAEGSTVPTKVHNFPTNSPFYLDITKLDAVDDNLKGVTFDTVNCARVEDGVTVVDQNACYVKISDYY